LKGHNSRKLSQIPDTPDKMSIESVILVLIFNGFHTSVAVVTCFL